jgi:hypothetical protein
MIQTPQNIEHVRVSALREYERNARTHSANQVRQIVEAVRTFGWTNPLLIDGANLVIAGHGRLAAARELGMTEVPCIRVTGLTEAQVRALILSDNKIAMNAGWDDKLLAEELRTIQFDIDSGELDFKTDEVVGFDIPEMEELMKILEPPEPEEEPRVAEMTAEPTVSQAGDTWLLGNHRLTIGGGARPHDADAVIRLWERETGEEAKLSKGGETFAARAKAMGIEFVRPKVKSQKARRSD